MQPDFLRGCEAVHDQIDYIVIGGTMSAADFTVILFSIPFLVILYLAVYFPLKMWSGENFAYKLTFKQISVIMILTIISNLLFLSPLSRFLIELLPNLSVASSERIAQLLLISIGLPIWAFIIWRLAHVNK